MSRKKIVSALLLWQVLWCAAAQSSVTISGYVLDAQHRGIELAGVSLPEGGKTVLTGPDGFYSIEVPYRDTLALKYSCLAFEPTLRLIPNPGHAVRVNVSMERADHALGEVTVRGQRQGSGTFETLDPSRIRLLPDATGGSIEAMLVTFAGVSSHNELSSQYSVRGGNFDENLVYVNGTEVYRPLLIRAGQQEGLSFINPDMVQSVQFSAGGFNARYGDKMSSVLDIQYKKPTHFEAAAHLSLLGTNLYVGHASKDGRFTQIHGFRYKTNAYLLGTLDTKAEYKPSFTDYQTYLTWRPDPTLELSFLGNFSQNTYAFIPTTQETEFGPYNLKYTMSVYFDGQEKDRFQTGFGAFSLKKTLTEALTASLQTSAFRTSEDENYDITGQYFLSQTPIRNNKADTANTRLLGLGTYHEHARNHLLATVANIAQQVEYLKGNHRLQEGFSLQFERISDRIREWEMRDSAGYTLPYTDNTLHAARSLRSEAEMNSRRIQAYLLDNIRFRKNAGLFVADLGLRANYWDFNRELLLSPRASITFIPNGKKDLVFRLATGIYYQAPFYKELRDTLTQDGTTRVVLNRNIKAPRTVQCVAGMDYRFTGLDRPFKLTTELYYKAMDRLIPYTVDNVRIRYMGRNLGDGYSAGLDTKLFGELLPGTDSWISLSLMRSHETLNGRSIPRPNEQRYNVSLYFQDYFPNNPKWTMSLKFIWADGLPFGAPNGNRNTATLRIPPYRRVDIGLSGRLMGGEDPLLKRGVMRSIRTLWIGLDCFNLLGIRNTNSYYWVTDIANRQFAVPSYLTGRLLNLRLTLEI
jgi:hypothetical protein